MFHFPALLSVFTIDVVVKSLSTPPNCSWDRNVVQAVASSTMST